MVSENLVAPALEGARTETRPNNNFFSMQVSGQLTAEFISVHVAGKQEKSRQVLVVNQQAALCVFSQRRGEKKKTTFGHPKPPLALRFGV